MSAYTLSKAAMGRMIVRGPWHVKPTASDSMLPAEER